MSLWDWCSIGWWVARDSPGPPGVSGVSALNSGAFIRASVENTLSCPAESPFFFSLSSFGSCEGNRARYCFRVDQKKKKRSNNYSTIKTKTSIAPLTESQKLVCIDSAVNGTRSGLKSGLTLASDTWGIRYPFMYLFVPLFIYAYECV